MPRNNHILDQLSLYVHFPWCVRKCPYCDFNSHALKGEVPEQQYIEALLADLRHDLQWVDGRCITSIFLGGGTPSLFSATALENLFTHLQQYLKFADDVEITIEANPGTLEHDHFSAYREVGINRVSLGVQSFNDRHLKQLGRIHSADEAKRAVAAVQAAGIDNINIDLMHGLPQQTVAEALLDLNTAMALGPTHLSWYQLTIERNTVFFKQQPVLPAEETLVAIEAQGSEVLTTAGFAQYEVSAWSKPNKTCRHNRHYWQFGDYLGIGAGAHSKLTCGGKIVRRWKTRQPKDYLKVVEREVAKESAIEDDAIAMEFMMNVLRLTEGFSTHLYADATGQDYERLRPQIDQAIQAGLLSEKNAVLKPTALGFQFLDSLVALF